MRGFVPVRISRHGRRPAGDPEGKRPVLIKRFLNSLLEGRLKDFEVAHREVLPSQEAQFASLCPTLAPPLAETLRRLGIPNLYSHQVQALDCIRSGKSTVVATPTSSGKSLIYNLAAAEALIESRDQRALYLFPIKALARDQLEALQVFLAILKEADDDLSFTASIYDGDTTAYQRAKIRQQHPHFLLTNPDMLHYALLAFHAKWETFWKKLRFVIVDEMHTYRGIFGSHVAQIFRRLKRICAHYGSSPQFIFLSATIRNPAELAGKLTGIETDRIAVITENGSPHATRNFVFLQPEQAVGGSAAGSAAHLIVRAARDGLKTIAFTQSRRLTELVHMSVLQIEPRLKNRVSSYRAGFLPEERRVIEQKLSSGSLSAVISTSALEAGIDIGGLDLCLLVGYPGTIMTTWQRGGRVGRSGQESAIVLIPQPDALDQYIVRHPQQFLNSRYEIAVIDPHNVEILKAHLPCAAAELPILASELDPVKDKAVLDTAAELAASGELRQTARGDQWLSAQLQPHRKMDIRSVGPSYSIVKIGGDGKPWPLGKNEGIRALKECHPGAIYLHHGETYRVESLDLERKAIQVSSFQAPYFTRAVSEKETEILDVLTSKPAGNFVIRLGRLRVTERIVGYEKRRLFTQELLAANPLDLPPQTFETVGFWLEIEPLLANQIQKDGLHFMGGIHAVEHALISMFPLFAVCDRNDIGGISIPFHPQVEKGAIFVYDGYPGGIGLAARGYEIILPLLERTRELVASCPCTEGCPACIHSPKCGNGNKPLDKAAALKTLEFLTGARSIAECVAAPTGGDSVEEDQCEFDSGKQGFEMPGYRIGFFDLETQRLADEVGGWQNAHLMGISVAVLHEEPGGICRVYREGEIPALIEDLKQLDLVVGFNISRFDYRVLSGYSRFNFDGLPTFDILQEVHKCLGFRLSLNHLAEKTLAKGKGADGLKAVEWFRSGEWDNLIQYCREDVEITRDLFYHGLEKQYLLYSDRQSRLLRLPCPWDLEKMVRGAMTSTPAPRLSRPSR